jgi:hypothetical protein
MTIIYYDNFSSFFSNISEDQQSLGDKFSSSSDANLNIANILNEYFELLADEKCNSHTDHDSHALKKYSFNSEKNFNSNCNLCGNFDNQPGADSVIVLKNLSQYYQSVSEIQKDLGEAFSSSASSNIQLSDSLHDFYKTLCKGSKKC